MAVDPLALAPAAETVPARVRPLVAELPFSRIREISRIGMELDDVIALWFGEPDRPSPGFINDAATRAMAEGHTFYTQNRGIPELRRALSAYLGALYGREVGFERVTVTASGMNAIMLAMQMVAGVGENVVTVAPLWPNVLGTILIQGAEPRAVALAFEGGRWRLDLERLFDACDGNTRAIFVNSPSNPTGWVMSAAEQRTVLEFCRARGIWLIADEVYDRIHYGARHAPSFVEIAEAEDAVIAINSFSKTWCMTGWRLGWITAPESLGRTLEMMNEYNIACATTFAQHAGITAIAEGEPFVAETLARYRAGRDLVYRRLCAMPRVSLALPEGAFYAFFAVDGLSDSLALAKRLLLEHGVGMAPGSAFGAPGEGFLRLCFASTPETLSRALDRLEAGLR